MPALRKLCTNCRWNSRNAMSNGPEVISVAAQMIDQSIPWSTEAKTARPTVSGRVDTEFGDYERPDVVVPMEAHHHEAVGEVDRLRRRHVHAPKHAERRAALDARRLLKLLGHRLEGLPQEEDAEGRAQVGQSYAGQRVQQPERTMVM